MKEKTFNVILTGKFDQGVDASAAMEAFAKLFKLTPEKAQALFKKAPCPVKTNVDATTAKKFLAALEKIGVRASIAHVTVSEAVATPKPVTVPPVAPQASSLAPPKKAATDFKGLHFDIIGRPDYAFLKVELPANQTLKVEASAMATMDTHIRMRTKMKGGFGRLLTGESLFINEFTAENAPAEIGIAPATPGDLCHRYLDGDTLFLQNSAFVAAAPEVEVSTKWQGMVKGFFSGENLFLIRASGHGDLWFNTYGATIELDVDGDYVVDTGNIVAFTEGLEYRITKVGGYKSLFFSGEGFVCRFSGKGKVWIQTRSVGAFAAWAQPYRPVKG